MTSKLKRLLLPLLRAAAKGGPVTFRMKSAASQALFLIGKATSKSNGGRLRREEKTKLRREYMAALRTDVFHRAEDTCELCLMAAPTELHHLEGGSGRKALQEVHNCMAVCMDCHRAFHRRPEEFRSVVEAWAEHHGYPVPRRFRGEPKPLTPHITHAQLKRSAP